MNNKKSHLTAYILLLSWVLSPSLFAQDNPQDPNPGGQSKELVPDAAFKQIFSHSRELIKQEKWLEAEVLFQDLVRGYPDDPQVHFWLGQVYLALDRADEGIAQIKQSVLLSPDNNIRLKIALAKAYRQVGQLLLAEKLYDEIITLSKDEEYYETDPELHRLDEIILALEQIVRQTSRSKYGKEAKYSLQTLYRKQAQNMVKALQTTDADASAAPALAKKLLNSNDVDSAQQILEAYLTRMPNDAQGQYMLGQVFMKRRDYTAGVLQIEKSVATAPENMKLKLELANAYERVGRDTDAWHVYAEIIAGAENEALIARAEKQMDLLQAQEYTQQGEHQKAADVYQSLVALYPDDLKLLRLLANSYEISGQYNEVVLVVEKLQAADPENTKLRLLLAGVYEKNNQHELAVNQYQEIINQEPDSNDAKLAMNSLGLEEGLTLARKNEFDLALKKFQQVIDIIPDQAEANYYLGTILQKQKKYEEAEAALKIAIQSSPANLKFKLKLGSVYTAMGKLTEATEYYQQVISLGNRGAEAEEAHKKLSSISVDISRKGKSLLDDGDLDGAQNIYEALIIHEPEDARWYYWLAQIYKKRQEYKKVVELIEKSSNLAPDNTRLLRDLGEAYLEADMLDDAERAFLRKLELSPYDAESRLNLAIIYDRQGRQQRSNQQVINLLELDPAPDIREKALNLVGLEKGKELMEAGKLDEALAEFERLLSIVPDDFQANSWLGDLFLLQENTGAAEDAFIKAASIDHPEKPKVLLKLADLYASTEHDDDAVRVYNEVITNYEFSREATQARGKLQPILIKKADILLEASAIYEKDSDIDADQLVDEGRKLLELTGFNGAQKIFMEVIKRQPENSQAHYWLGRIFFKVKNYTDAIALFKKSVELVPDELLFKEWLGKAYFKAGRYSMVVETIEPLLGSEEREDAHRYIDMRMQVAESYQYLGKRLKSQQHLLKIIQIEPQGESAARALDLMGFQEGLTLARQGLLDEALAIFKHILSVVPEIPKVNYEAGKIYLEQKRYAQAEAALKKVLLILPDHADGNLLLARLYVETENLDEAIVQYERIIELDIDIQQVQEAKSKLKGLYRHHAKRLVRDLKVSADKVDVALPLAKKLIHKGELEGAQEILEALIAHRPDDAQVNYWLGQVHVKHNDNDAAKKYLKRSVSIAPGNMQLRYELGKFYDRTDSLDDAKRIYKEVAAGSENEDLVKQANRQLALAWGRDYTEQGDFQAALAEYQALLKLYPQDSTVLGLVGWSYLRLGETQKADEIFEELLLLASDDVDINMRMAVIYANRGDMKRYKEQLIKVIKLDPSGQRVREALDVFGYREGVGLSQGGEPEKALQVFQRILSEVPNVPMVNYQVGLIYHQKKNFIEAEAAFKKVLLYEPGHLEAGMELAQLYVDINQENKAIATLEQVAEEGRGTVLGEEAVSKLSWLYTQRASRLRNAGDIEFAIREYEEILEYNPESVSTHYNLGLLYIRQGRKDAALEEFRTVTRLSPDSGAYRNMAKLQKEQGEFLLAAESYAYAVSLTEDEAEAKGIVRRLGVVLAQYFLEEDQPSSALTVLESFRDQNDPEVNYYLGVIYRQQGDMESAVAAFQDAVEMSDAKVSLRYNLAILYQRTNEDQLALNQYREILKTGKPGDVYVERARRNITAVENRLRRFTSTLRYDTTIGDSTVTDEVREVETSSFVSSVNYNLATRFRPRKNIVVTLDTGFNYATNHSNETDSTRPQIGLRANINNPDKFLTASATYTESHGLLLDTFAGRGINLRIVGGIRAEDPVDYLKNLLRVGDKEPPDDGESEIERSPAAEAGEEERETDEAGLRRALNEAYQEIIPDKKERPIPVEEEEVKRYIVRKGDTLWDISAVLLLDPFLWPEIWQTNPDIENPHLIFPDDVITLFYIGGVPVLRIEREGKLITLPPELVALSSEEMARRAGQIRQNIDEDLATFENALNLMALDRYEEALLLLEKIHEVIPESPIINLNMGIAYLHLNRLQEAEQTLKYVLEVDPDNLHARLVLGDLYARMDRINDAIAVLKEVIAMAKGTLHILVTERQLRGMPARRAVHVLEQAERQLREILARRAERVLEQVDLTPADIAAVIDDGVHLMGMSDLEGARQVFHGLLKRFPDIGEAYYWLAQINIRQGNDEIAIAFLEQSLVYLPDNMAYRFVLAKRYENQNRLTDAEQIYLQIIDETDDEQLVTSARRRLALLYAARFSAVGDYATALSMYLEMQNSYPDDTELLARIGAMYEALEQPGLAVESYTMVIALNPGDIKIRLRLAALYEQLKMHQNAREQLAAVMALDPDEATRKIVLDRLGLQQGLELLRDNKLNAALAMFENVLSVVPDEPLAKLNLGIIYTRQGRYTEAEVLFIEILEEDPRNLSARFRLGMLYYETGRLNKAITVLEQVVREGAGTDIGAQAAEKLKELEAERLRTLTLPQLKKAEPQPKTFQAGLTYNDFEPENSTLTETRTWGGSLTATYPTIDWGNWALLYDYRSTDNEQSLGTDYAFTAHQFRLSYNRPVPRVPRLFGSATLGWERQSYTNADTNARFALGLNEERENIRTTISFNLSYRAHDDMTLFAGYSYRDTQSNLPVGLVYASNGVPVAFQSVILGDFSSSFVNLGFQFRF